MNFFEHPLDRGRLWINPCFKQKTKVGDILVMDTTRFAQSCSAVAVVFSYCLTDTALKAAREQLSRFVPTLARWRGR